MKANECKAGSRVRIVTLKEKTPAGVGTDDSWYIKELSIGYVFPQDLELVDLPTSIDVDKERERLVEVVRSIKEKAVKRG